MSSVRIISHTLNDHQGPFVQCTITPTTLIVLVQQANHDAEDQASGQSNNNNQGQAIRDSTMGSYVYAISPKKRITTAAAAAAAAAAPRDPVLVSKMFENPTTIEAAERLAKLLVLKLGQTRKEEPPVGRGGAVDGVNLVRQRGVYVGVSDEGVDNIDITDIVRWVYSQV